MEPVTPKFSEKICLKTTNVISWALHAHVYVCVLE